SASHDPDGDQLTYAWTQTAGPTVVLNDATTAKATFTAPTNLQSDTTLSFTLTVTDNHLKTSTAVQKVTVTHTVTTPPPPPPPPPSPPPGTGGGGVDKFGVNEIYPTKPGGEEWFMNMQDPNNDPRVFKGSQTPTFTKNPDGSWKVPFGGVHSILCCPNEVRYNALTSSGFDPSKIIVDEKQLVQRGYMQSPNDWKNVEITGYVKFNAGDASRGWTWEARGGRHTGSGAPAGCEDTMYNAHILWGNGNVRWEKEQWHVHIVSTPYRPSPAIGAHKWIGFKAVMYNIQQNGKTVVKLEMWEDPNNDNHWVRAYDLTDAGGWGDGGQTCGGSPDQIITWGGPMVLFRWDYATDVDVKNFSVREIQPPTQ
ncbi:MAG TPA: hypothetical protein VE843_08485, partial [Ktedonobacteraceae bacterium]|nr:hypothetical protein [Ktedonobacteraceae bacterium]